MTPQAKEFFKNHQVVHTYEGGFIISSLPGHELTFNKPRKFHFQSYSPFILQLLQ